MKRAQSVYNKILIDDNGDCEVFISYYDGYGYIETSINISLTELENLVMEAKNTKRACKLG